MARTVAELPKGSRITDYISLGVLNTMIPRTAVDAALEASSRQSIRQRDLPAHVMVSAFGRPGASRGASAF